MRQALLVDLLEVAKEVVIQNKLWRADLLRSSVHQLRHSSAPCEDECLTGWPTLQMKLESKVIQGKQIIKVS